VHYLQEKEGVAGKGVRFVITIPKNDKDAQVLELQNLSQRDIGCLENSLSLESIKNI
jgi:hypothetical protein